MESIERLKRGEDSSIIAWTVYYWRKPRLPWTVDKALWRIVKIRAEREEMTLMDALEHILREYIKDHGKEYGYPPEQIKRR